MTDRPEPHPSPDGQRIDLQQQDELRYWTQTLAVSEQRLKQVVEHVGPAVQAVRNALGR
ncbi:DUF3606 domain-containing protein [Solimonas variicoloris]|uniref:DUF3606 domain-containing protein n=1 Tax=Solimonas variicoloris TaxID=254408 RepID=UPI00036F79F6|nr:DUF3606 domain-containing protein [Solimonas variicoloris]